MDGTWWSTKLAPKRNAVEAAEGAAAEEGVVTEGEGGMEEGTAEGVAGAAVVVVDAAGIAATAVTAGKYCSYD